MIGNYSTYPKVTNLYIQSLLNAFTNCGIENLLVGLIIIIVFSVDAAKAAALFSNFQTSSIVMSLLH